MNDYTDWSAVVRLHRITGKHNQFESWIPGIELDAHRRDPQHTILVFDPDFSKMPWQISPSSGLVCYPTMQTTPIRYIADEHKLPGFVRVSEVHRGYFYIPIGSCVVVGIKVQQWKWLALDDLKSIYLKYRKENNLAALRIAGHDGLEIDIGSSFDRTVAKIPKVSVRCANKTSMSGLFYLESTNYLQYAGDDVEIQMYPRGFHNRYASLTNDQKNQMFSSRSLFTDVNPKYLQCFADFSFEQQMVCRLVACSATVDLTTGITTSNTNNKCCYRTNCNRKCGSRVCCYGRECINTPDIYDDLLKEWMITLDTEVENSTSLRTLNVAFAKTNGQYNDVNTIVDYLLKYFDKERVMIIQLGCIDSESGVVENIKKFHHSFYSICYKGVVMYAFEKFRFRNRGKIESEIFDGWLFGIKSGKSSDELIAFIKRQLYQEKAQARIKPMYDAAINAWKELNAPKPKQTKKKNKR